MNEQRVRWTAARLAPPMIALLVLAAAVACKKGGGGATGGATSSGGGPRGDGLFVATAPSVVPEELDPNFEAMGISRLYVVVATLSSNGRITPAPPPPTRTLRPTMLVLMGEPGSDAVLAGADGKALGEAWATSLAKIVADARGWAKVAGIHVHLLPAPAAAPALAAAATALRTRLSLPVSFTLSGDVPAEAWKPLEGAVDEALVMALGRRPETGDRMVSEFSEENARAFPIPFRLLIVPGGYGRTGKNADTFDGKRLSDGQIDQLSEDRNLDFDFGQVLSNVPGSIYNFKPHAGGDGGRSALAADGGFARFQVLTMYDIKNYLSTVSRWGAPNFRGRVFLVDGLPTDGHILGFPVLEAFLTGKNIDPRLEVGSKPESGAKGGFEFSLSVSNASATPTELSHYNNWVQVRLEGGVFTSAKIGDFDRFELLSSTAEKSPMAPFGRAVVLRMFENFFAPGESNVVGPFRVSGGRPRAYVSYRLTTPGGATIDGTEKEIDMQPPQPTPRPKAPAKPVPPRRKK